MYLCIAVDVSWYINGDIWEKKAKLRVFDSFENYEIKLLSTNLQKVHRHKNTF